MAPPAKAQSTNVKDPKQRVNYQETSWAQPVQETEFKKYVPKPKAVSKIVYPPVKPRRAKPEVVADEANADN